MVLPSVTSHNDLVTAREATCQGFLELAKAKTEKASLYIDKAMEYWEELKQKADASLLRTHTFYLACGELKGGIDPAGADEHWKTARSALDRVATVFASQPENPALFFIGAAIEEAMAVELFDWLQSGKLRYAANLTVPQQVADLISWLVSL